MHLVAPYTEGEELQTEQAAGWTSKETYVAGVSPAAARRDLRTARTKESSKFT